MARYRVLCADLVSNIIREELPISDLEYSEVLNSPGSMSGWISLDDPKCTRLNLDPGATAIYIERGGLLVWGGILWTARVDSVDRKLKLGAEGFWGYFRHRVVRNRNGMLYASGQSGATYRPTVDVTTSSVYGTFDNVNLFNNVNTAAVIPGHAIGDNPPFNVPSYQCRVGVPAGALTGLAITSVQVGVVCQAYGAVRNLQMNLRIAGVNYPSVVTGHYTSTSTLQTFVDTWTTNPATGVAWTVPQIEAFATSNAIGWNTDLTTSGTVDTFVSQMWMTVTWDIGGTAAFTGVDQLKIAQDLINGAQAQPGGSLGITVGTEVSGVGRDTIYHAYERKNVGQAVEELAALTAGFDFAVSVAWDSAGTTPLKTLHLYYPRRGQRLDGLVFNHNIAGTAKFTNGVDASSAVNQLDIIGAGDGDQMLIATLSDPSLFSHFPLLEGTISAKDVNDVDTLVAIASAQLGRRRAPRETPGIEKQADIWPDYGSFQVGDEGLLVISDGWLAINSYHRVQSLTIKVGNEGQETMIPGFVSADASVL